MIDQDRRRRRRHRYSNNRHLDSKTSLDNLDF
jgi:hypothetical protein